MGSYQHKQAVLQSAPVAPRGLPLYLQQFFCQTHKLQTVSGQRHASKHSYVELLLLLSEYLTT